MKHYRQKMGISQEAFAEKCGLHRTYISAIECCRRSISLENIQRIADALGIETYRLFLEANDALKNQRHSSPAQRKEKFDYVSGNCAQTRLN